MQTKISGSALVSDLSESKADGLARFDQPIKSLRWEHWGKFLEELKKLFGVTASRAWAVLKKGMSSRQWPSPVWHEDYMAGSIAFRHQFNHCQFM